MGYFWDEGAEAIVPGFCSEIKLRSETGESLWSTAPRRRLGTTAGLDPHGVLLLQTDEGTCRADSRG